ncbi:MAG: hypothetical protein ACK5KO_04955 [Arachnia sp.]
MKRRSSTLGWLALLGLIAALVAVIGVLGGFGTGAAPYLGRQAQLGEVVETRWWDYRIDSFTVDPEYGEVIVAMNVTNRMDESAVSLIRDSFLIKLPNGDLLQDPLCYSDYGTEFHPRINVDAECSFTWPDASSAETPLVLRVIMTDQRLSESLLEGGTVVAGDAVAHVEAEATVIDP